MIAILSTAELFDYLNAATSTEDAAERAIAAYKDAKARGVPVSGHQTWERRQHR